MASAPLQRHVNAAGDSGYVLDGRRERYPMSMRRMTPILLAALVVTGLSISAGRRAQRFLAELPIVDHSDA